MNHINLILDLELEKDEYENGEIADMELYYSQFPDAANVFFQDEYGTEEPQDF